MDPKIAIKGLSIDAIKSKGKSLLIFILYLLRIDCLKDHIKK